MVDAAEARARLLARREEIGAVLAETQEDVEPVALDQQSQGRLSRIDAIQRQEMAKEARRRREQELMRIEAALERVDEGEWGFCTRCGEEIAPRRLELDPAIALCVDCAGR